MMKDLTDPRWIKFKGVLFLLLGIFSALLIFLEQPTFKLAALLGLCIWAFCRAYYFAFYVLQHYVDPGFRYSGLWSAARNLLSRRR